MEDKPRLDSAKFTFTQEGNCMDSNNIEEIEIKCLSDIGIDGSDSCLYVLKTDGWSIDNLAELENLITRIKKSLFPNEDAI
jgi:hypothetical protein